jgi:hypothetical protein
MRAYESLSLGIPDILLPKPGVDLTKWAVIACDQYTSEPDYWRKAADLVGEAPSTLNLIYPEVYLNEKDPAARIARIREHMDRYLAQGIFDEAEGMIYIERTTGPHPRKGLVACLDLEHYDFSKGATSLIRATEGTILERIPPRVRIRQGAPLESPHIMVLIDDPGDTVIGPLTADKGRLAKVYDFELMLGSGRLAGWRVGAGGKEKGVADALAGLADPAQFAVKYDLPSGTPVLLYAMGDGNHSLATAKTIWEQAKAEAPDKTAVMGSPLRWALVELVNLHDEALVFEPIHRVLFGLAAGRDILEDAKRFYPGGVTFRTSCCLDSMKEEIDGQSGPPHKIGMVAAEGFGILEITAKGSNLPVGTLQNFLDPFLKGGGAREIDYVHGTEPVADLGRKPGNAGFYLPAMDKRELFKTVILDGALPRKTFSMGEAWEKRFYMEARRLT